MKKGVLLLLSLVFVAPSVVGDHVYSHRYLVLGRILDSEGKPAAGVPVNITLVNFGSAELGPCAQDPNAGRRVRVDAEFDRHTYVQTTSSEGDYYICSHMDAPIPKSAKVVVEALGESHEAPGDDNYRRSVVSFQLRRNLTLPPGTLESFERRYFVTGFVWKPTERQGLENIFVNGLALGNINVTVTLTTDGGKNQTHTLTTDRYGRFSTIFSLDSPLREGRVRVTSSVGSYETEADPLYRYSDVVIVAPRDPSSGVDLWVWGGGLVGAVALVGGGWWAWKKIQESRELKEAAARSPRKRSRR